MNYSIASRGLRAINLAQYDKLNKLMKVGGIELNPPAERLINSFKTK